MQRTILVDDLDGSEGGGVTTVQFALDGQLYEIDLSPANDFTFRDTLAPYIVAGRQVGGTKKKSGGKSGKASRDDLPAIREWGQANGWEVAERGRVPKDLIAAYDAQHQGRAA